MKVSSKHLNMSLAPKVYKNTITKITTVIKLSCNVLLLITTKFQIGQIVNKRENFKVSKLTPS